MTSITAVTRYLSDLFYDDLDPRFEDLPFIGMPWPVVMLCGAYLYFVLKIGPRWMESRKPFELKTVIAAYNIFQMLINSYLFLMIISHTTKQENYRFFCIPSPRRDYSPIGNIVVHVSYTYHISRIVDLLDTVFFVLRKKKNQITFLHVYHHVIMVLGGYFILKVQSGGGYVTILGILNSFVHVLMYAYYFLTNFRPELKTSIWWKRNITQLQLVQFTLLWAYAIKAIFFTECENSKILAWYMLLQSTAMLYLFSKFYYKAYLKKKNDKTI